MAKSLSLSLLIFLLLNGCNKNEEQANLELDYSPNFSAIVVKNLEASSQWYQSVLGMTVKSRAGDATYKLAILESQVLTIELIELSSSLIPQELLDGKPQGTQIQGLFKIGFHITNVDACLKALSDLKITVPQIWTDPTTNKRNFIITDPDGNLLQFFEQ